MHFARQELAWCFSKISCLPRRCLKSLDDFFDRPTVRTTRCKIGSKTCVGASLVGARYVPCGRPLHALWAPVTWPTRGISGCSYATVDFLLAKGTTSTQVALQPLFIRVFLVKTPLYRIVCNIFSDSIKISLVTDNVVVKSTLPEFPRKSWPIMSANSNDIQIGCNRFKPAYNVEEMWPIAPLARIGSLDYKDAMDMIWHYLVTVQCDVGKTYR